MTRRWGGRERGSVSVFFAIVAAGWVMMLLLIVVGGGRIRAYQRADNIAAEAARAAGQAIEAGTAIAGEEKTIDRTRATAAAQAYLLEAGATGTVRFEGDQTVVVTATVGYPNPTGISFPGDTGDVWYATGEARATLLVG
ncbi:MAG: hypothetical protein HOV79_08155 [Hamadaea sp.]|nr:hypothetical protein [Hamadaea sp.]